MSGQDGYPALTKFPVVGSRTGSTDRETAQCDPDPRMMSGRTDRKMRMDPGSRDQVCVIHSLKI